MNIDPSTLSGSSEGPTHLVRGCPCYREFGEERVCLNNDSVYPINAISVDPSFFNQLESRPLLEEFRSDNKSMCYLLMFLDRDEGYCYCVSQNQRIRINHKDVKVTEIDNALEFVTSSEKSRDGVLCSDCMYRYLITLGESSDAFLTDSEREEIVANYVRALATNMAIELSNYERGDKSLELNDHLWNYLREINRSRSHWASMVLNLKKNRADKEVIGLIHAYRTLARLESVFLFQVLSLDDPNEETDPLNILKFMVGVSERVISINNQIREKTNMLLEKKALPSNIHEMLIRHSQKRKRMEYRFINLVSALHKIDTQTT